MFGSVPGASDGINFHLRAGRETTYRWEDVPVKPVPPGGRSVPSNDSKLRPWWVVYNSGGVVDKRNGVIGNGFRRDKVVQFGDLKSTDDAMLRAAYENTADYLAFKEELLEVKHGRCLQVHDARLMNYLEHRYDTVGPFLTPTMHGTSASTASGVSAYIAHKLAMDEVRNRKLAGILQEDSQTQEEADAEADASLWRDYSVIDDERSRTIR